MVTTDKRIKALIKQRNEKMKLFERETELRNKRIGLLGQQQKIYKKQIAIINKRIKKQRKLRM